MSRVTRGVVPLSEPAGMRLNLMPIEIVIDMGKFQKSILDLKLSNGDHEEGDGWGVIAVQESKPALRKPSMYKVIMINDDYTPMDFVVQVLETFFYMNREQATGVMLKVHTQGRAVCGIYPRDVAETKAAQANQCAKENQHPLLCEIEADESGDESD